MASSGTGTECRALAALKAMVCNGKGHEEKEMGKGERFTPAKHTNPHIHDIVPVINRE